MPNSAKPSRPTHGIVLMDKAGWHTSGDLVVPENLRLILPAIGRLDFAEPYRIPKIAAGIGVVPTVTTDGMP